MISVRAETVTRGPYIQLLTTNSVVIRWRTDEISPSFVWFGTNGPSTRSQWHEVGEKPFPREKENGKGAVQLPSGKKTTSEHAVQLTGLLPETKYFYAIERENGALVSSPNYFFITAPSIGSARPFRFWVVGDPGTRTTNQTNVRNAYYKFSASKRTDGWLLLGDNAYPDGTDKEYQGSIFDVYGDILAQSCVWPTFGNHDGRSAHSGRQSGVYYNVFTLPAHGESGGISSGTEAYYSFDYGNAHFICLNSSDVNRSPNGKMMKWLRKDLRENKQMWTVAYFHHPPYTKGSHDSDTDHVNPDQRDFAESGVRLKEIRENALPIFEKAGVDLVLAGHSHDYERSFLLDGHYGTSDTLRPSHKKNSGDGRIDGNGAYIKPTPGPAPHEGTVYIVAGSSGKITGGKLSHPAMFTSQNQLGSLVLDFNLNRLDVTLVGVTAKALDHFTMIKGKQ